jgi:hypothetical protein
VHEQFDAPHAGGSFGVGYPEGMEAAVGRLGCSYYGRKKATARLKELQDLGIRGIIEGAGEEAHIVCGSLAGKLHRVCLQAMAGMLRGETAGPFKRTRWGLPVPVDARAERGDHAIDCPIEVIG